MSGPLAEAYARDFPHGISTLPHWQAIMHRTPDIAEPRHEELDRLWLAPYFPFWMPRIVAIDLIRAGSDQASNRVPNILVRRPSENGKLA